MTFGSNVQPRRIVKAAPKKWKCCDRVLAGHHARCPACGKKRGDVGHGGTV